MTQPPFQKFQANFEPALPKFGSTEFQSVMPEEPYQRVVSDAYGYKFSL